ncbi:MAG: hypothetical protein HQ481_19135 [Alphaproteobacteria bacterium]|nr:hypothetical protein [Alphaproteobacteria bacterium]
MSDDKPKVEFVDNPNPLKDKVKIKHGADPKEMIAKADEAVKKLGGEFEKLFTDNIRQLTSAIAEVKLGGERQKAGVSVLRRVLHDLRGQAGTFGYPLVSQVGDSACKFIDLSDDLGNTEIDVLVMHIDALKAVNQSKITGDGGPIGQELMSGLRKVIQKYNARGA